MKIWIKIAIAGIVGFGAGFGVGFLVHKKVNDIQFEVISEEEMDELEKNFNEKVESKKDDILDKYKNVEDLPEDVDKLKNALQGKTPYIQADQDQKMAYEKLWNATKEYSDEENANDIPTLTPDDDDANLDEEFLEQIEEEAAEAGNDFVDPPHVISLADFYNDRPDYDKITIDWFEPDNVWIDEREEIIADISSYIGMLQVNELFAKNTANDDPDIRFVRNDNYGSDYEIVRHHRSYKETVGGVD